MSEVKIYAAVAKAMGEIKRVSKDNRNAEQEYDFASVDDFMAMVGPICAENGLVTIIDEDSREFIEKPGKYGPTQWVSIAYQITTWHASGESLPPVRRHVEVIRNGPQAYGAAQSYVLKQYYRGLLAIPTGDKDDPESNRVPEEPAYSNAAIKKISADMFQSIKAMIDETGTDEEKFCAFFKVGALHDMTSKQASDAISMLGKKRMSQAREKVQDQSSGGDANGTA